MTIINNILTAIGVFLLLGSISGLFIMRKALKRDAKLKWTLILSLVIGAAIILTPIIMASRF